MDENLRRNAQEMLDELKEASERMHRAVRYARTLKGERSLEWLADQMEERYKAQLEFEKDAQFALEFLTRE